MKRIAQDAIKRARSGKPLKARPLGESKRDLGACAASQAISMDRTADAE